MTTTHDTTHLGQCTCTDDSLEHCAYCKAAIESDYYERVDRLKGIRARLRDYRQSSGDAKIDKLIEAGERLAADPLAETYSEALNVLESADAAELEIERIFSELKNEDERLRAEREVKEKERIASELREGAIQACVPAFDSAPIIRAKLPNPAAFDRVMNHVFTGKGVFATGSPRMAKTRAIGWRLIGGTERLGKVVFFSISAIEFAEEVSKRRGAVADYIRSLNAFRLVWIDDIADVQPTSAYLSALKLLFDARMKSDGSGEVAMTSQLSLDALLDHWSGKDGEHACIAEALVRRILEWCEVIDFDAP